MISAKLANRVSHLPRSELDVSGVLTRVRCQFGRQSQVCQLPSAKYVCLHRPLRALCMPVSVLPVLRARV
jgi:hypothetical protein